MWVEKWLDMGISWGNGVNVIKTHCVELYKQDFKWGKNCWLLERSIREYNLLCICWKHLRKGLFELQFQITAYYWKNHKGRILRQLFTSHVTSRGLEMDESMLPVLLILSWPSEVLHSSILKLGYGPKQCMGSPHEPTIKTIYTVMSICHTDVDNPSTQSFLPKSL